MPEFSDMKALVNAPRFDLFLIDASGVLHNDTGPIPGAKDVLAAIDQKKAPRYLATNNSSFSVADIQNRMQAQHMSFKDGHIISSGYGLSKDPQTSQLLEGKRVYLFGHSSSAYYVNNVKGATLVENYADAEVVVLSASLRDDMEQRFAELKQALASKPRTVVCPNPDRHIWNGNGLYRVAGHYAELLEKDGHTVHWFGKPHPNYSSLLRTIIDHEHGHKITENTVFFDDNPDNLAQVKADLGVYTCCIRNTGISQHLSEDEIRNRPNAPDAIFDRFSFL